jgi:hypothetical protein
MVSLFARSRRYTALSAAAAAAPLVTCTLYVTVTHGGALGIAALDYVAWALIVCSSLPLFALLPASRREKLLLAVASVPVNALIAQLWGFSLACFAFHSCL